MPIRKGDERLHRNCKKCGELFEPNGRCNWICDECNHKGQSSWVLKMIKLSKRVARRTKLEKRLKDVSNAKKLLAKKNKKEKPLYTTLPSK